MSGDEDQSALSGKEAVESGDESSPIEELTPRVIETLKNINKRLAEHNKNVCEQNKSLREENKSLRGKNGNLKKLLNESTVSNGVSHGVANGTEEEFNSNNLAKTRPESQFDFGNNPKDYMHRNNSSDWGEVSSLKSKMLKSGDESAPISQVIETLENLSKRLAEHNKNVCEQNKSLRGENKSLREEKKDLKKQLNESTVPNGVSHGVANGTAREINSNMAKTRFPESQFDVDNRKDYSNFMEKYYEMEKEFDRLEAEIEKQKNDIKLKQAVIDKLTASATLQDEPESENNKVLRAKKIELKAENKKTKDEILNWINSCIDISDNLEKFKASKVSGIKSEKNELEVSTIVQAEEEPESENKKLKCENMMLQAKQKDLENECSYWVLEYFDRYNNFEMLKASKVSGTTDDDDSGNENKEGDKNQVEPGEMDEFSIPLNCDVCCSFCVILFIFHCMKLELCVRRFLAYLQCMLGKKSGGKLKVGKCSYCLDDFYKVDLIEEVFHTPITAECTIDDALRQARERLKDQSYPAVLSVEYEKNPDGTQPVGHSVAMMPHGKYIDVQGGRYWEPTSDYPIRHIYVINVKKSMRAKLLYKCGLQKCKNECIVNCAKGSNYSLQ